MNHKGHQVHQEDNGFFVVFVLFVVQIFNSATRS